MNTGQERQELCLLSLSSFNVTISLGACYLWSEINVEVFYPFSHCRGLWVGGVIIDEFYFPAMLSFLLAFRGINSPWS